MMTTAFIRLWGKTVGAVAYNPATRIGTFEFEPGFLKTKLNPSPLKMPVSEARNRLFAFEELRDTPTFKGLPGLLADVLPDNYGNAVINAWLAQNGRPADSMNPVEMLCFIGKRGMGALEFEPPHPKTRESSTVLELERLVNIANEVLYSRENFTVNISQRKEKEIVEILKIGSSAGGARAKALIAYNDNTGEVRSGQTKAPNGFRHWLLKFDGVTDGQTGVTQGFGRVEMAYSEMAKNSGIEMTECRLLEENGRAHFMTRRFDRLNAHEKLHMQTFCALAHYNFNNITSYSYEQLFEVLRKLQLPYTDTEQLYLRMVFNVLARNCDDHTKNFSFLMDKTGTWKLAPAYDLCYSYRPGSHWVSRQSLSVNGKRENITLKDLLHTAEQQGITDAENLIERVQSSIALWNNYAAKFNVPNELNQLISKNLIKL